jgi:hypothetical protein
VIHQPGNVFLPNAALDGRDRERSPQIVPVDEFALPRNVLDFLEVPGFGRGGKDPCGPFEQPFAVLLESVERLAQGIAQNQIKRSIRTSLGLGTADESTPILLDLVPTDGCGVHPALAAQQEPQREFTLDRIFDFLARVIPRPEIIRAQCARARLLAIEGHASGRKPGRQVVSAGSAVMRACTLAITAGSALN